MNREQCRGCGYFRTGNGDRGSKSGMRFCHHYLDTGIRRKVGENEKCLSKSKVAKKLCLPFDAPIAQI